MHLINFLLYHILWQARRDSNPQPADLESAALPIRATGLQTIYFVSLCMLCLRQREQNFFNFNEPTVLFFATTCV